MLSVIVAMSRNNVIGIDNTLPWHLPEDLKYFKRLTSGHPIVMGRKTYDSIGRPLPKRRNIVITRQTELQIEGCEMVSSLEAALEASGSEEAFIIGGAEIYRQSLDLVDKLYITEVDTEIEGDAFFPEIDKSVWEEVARESHSADEKHAFNYAFVTYEKI